MPTFGDLKSAFPEDMMIFDAFGTMPEKKGRFLKLSQMIAKAIVDEQPGDEEIVSLPPKEALGPKATDAFIALVAFMEQS